MTTAQRNARTRTTVEHTHPSNPRHTLDWRCRTFGHEWSKWHPQHYYSGDTWRRRYGHYRFCERCLEEQWQ